MAEAPARAYPGIEAFLESQDRGSIAARFEDTKEALGKLPKLKADQGKRALAAIGHAEALLSQLFDVKDNLAEAASKKKGRR